MPSSLIFAALAAAWLAVLVPMIAKRRQEVVRVAESALASRVLHRPVLCRAACKHDQEVPVRGEQIVERELDGRQYRPGRGGFDPEAAALAARERYVFRQRVVLGLLIAVIVTLLLSLVASTIFWGMHLTLDVALLGYLVYRRKQVRIEEEVRNRRAARMAGSRARAIPAADAPVPEEEPPAEQQYEQPRYEHSRYGPSWDEQSWDEQSWDEESSDVEPPQPSPVRHGASPPPAHPTAVPLDLDDEDPTFDELDPAFEPRYRRAAGE